MSTGLRHLVTKATEAVDSIHINFNRRVEHNGRVYWQKSRRPLSGLVIHGANLFFRMAGNPVTVHADGDTWHKNELTSFCLLHAAEGFHAFATAEGHLMIQHLPGQAITTFISDGLLPQAVLAAAAREMARAHGVQTTGVNASLGAWSHGDSHLGNFLFDPAQNRARLIDFEVSHLPHLSELERHADDLLVFLQDLMGRVSSSNWIPAARCFLEHYRNHRMPSPDLFTALAKRMSPPQWIESLWWAVRTSYLGNVERTRRILALREVLESF